MKVYLEKDKKYKEVKGKTVGNILSELKINPTTVIVSKNGSLVLNDTKVSARDKINIFTVVSGG